VVWEVDKFSDPDKVACREASILVHGDYFVLVYSDPDSEFLMIGRQEEMGGWPGVTMQYTISEISPWSSLGGQVANLMANGGTGDGFSASAAG